MSIAFYHLLLNTIYDLAMLQYSKWIRQITILHTYIKYFKYKYSCFVITDVNNKNNNQQEAPCQVVMINVKLS